MDGSAPTSKSVNAAPFDSMVMDAAAGSDGRLLKVTTTGDIASIGAATVALKGCVWNVSVAPASSPAPVNIWPPFERSLLLSSVTTTVAPEGKIGLGVTTRAGPFANQRPTPPPFAV